MLEFNTPKTAFSCKNSRIKLVLNDGVEIDEMEIYTLKHFVKKNQIKADSILLVHGNTTTVSDAAIQELIKVFSELKIKNWAIVNNALTVISHGFHYLLKNKNYKAEIFKNEFEANIWLNEVLMNKKK